MAKNMEFTEWSRSSAFSLSLCGWAIKELMIMREDHLNSIEAGCDLLTGMSFTMRSTKNYLSRRGLIERSKVNGYEGNFVLTKEGHLVCELLVAAGF